MVFVLEEPELCTSMQFVAQRTLDLQKVARICVHVVGGWGDLRVFPGGDQVDGLPPAPSNAPWEYVRLEA